MTLSRETALPGVGRGAAAILGACVATQRESNTGTSLCARSPPAWSWWILARSGEWNREVTRARREVIVDPPHGAGVVAVVRRSVEHCVYPRTGPHGETSNAWNRLIASSVATLGTRTSSRSVLAGVSRLAHSLEATRDGSGVQSSADHLLGLLRRERMRATVSPIPVREYHGIEHQWRYYWSSYSGLRSRSRYETVHRGRLLLGYSALATPTGQETPVPPRPQ